MIFGPAPPQASSIAKEDFAEFREFYLSSQALAKTTRAPFPPIVFPIESFRWKFRVDHFDYLR